MYAELTSDPFFLLLLRYLSRRYILIIKTKDIDKTETTNGILIVNLHIMHGYSVIYNYYNYVIIIITYYCYYTPTNDLW